ncbi:MAG: alpha/beta fold hydrolase [Candidatus Promineifilaceae bacterium]
MKVLKLALIILAATVLLTACNGNKDDSKEGDSALMAEDSASAEKPGDQDESGETASQPESEAAQQPEIDGSLAEQVLPPATDEQMEIMPKPSEEIVIEAADGLQLASSFFPGLASEPTPGVILLHMNGRNRFDWEDYARQLSELGYGVLTTDFRGHGETGGKRDWVQAEDDLQRIFDYFAGREEIDESRIGVVGASIGANMALVLGDIQSEIPGVVLLSPGLDYMGVTTEDRVIAYGDRPLLIVAADDDPAAAESSRDLAELALGDATLEIYDEAGHGTSMFGPHPELGTLISDWLHEHVGGIDRSESSDQGSALPTPTLFNTSWEDRSLYRPGLVDSEAGVLDELPGAPVYHIDLAISSDQMSVAGRLETLYTNQEDTDLSEVYFHLYPKILGGEVTVSALIVDGERTEPEYELSQTVLRVPLEEPLAPGEQTVIAMEFIVDVPSEPGNNYGVFTAREGVLALAHFFPQIAVFDDQGWNIDYPPANADVTYTDASFYLVRVTAPEDQVLVTSGIEIDRQTAGDNQVVAVAAGPARDFYLASSEDYVATSQQVGETTINSYGFPEFEEYNALALRYAAGAMESFNERFGAYPYTEFDIAPTPNMALAVEYPGVVVVRTALYNPTAMLGDLQATFYLEGAVAHEVGHQWFYNVIGSDQIDEPWLDEALTQHVTYLYYVDAYGEENAEGFRDSFYDRWDRVERADIPIGLPAGEYSGSKYGAIVYGRGPLFFDALENEMGEQVFASFLREYYQKNKWGISTGPELKALAEEHCGCDLTPLFEEWVGDMTG